MSAIIVSVCNKPAFVLTYNLLYSVMMIKSHKTIVKVIDKIFSIMRMSKCRLCFASYIGDCCSLKSIFFKTNELLWWLIFYTPVRADPYCCSGHVAF